jgi:hypothetical protein
MLEVENPDNYCSDQILNSSTINNASSCEKLKSRRKGDESASESLKYFVLFFISPSVLSFRFFFTCAGQMFFFFKVQILF